jgi:hypothetical protein
MIGRDNVIVYKEHNLTPGLCETLVAGYRNALIRLNDYSQGKWHL